MTMIVLRKRTRCPHVASGGFGNRFDLVIVQVPYLMESGLSDRVAVHVLDARGVAMYGGPATITTVLV